VRSIQEELDRFQEDIDYFQLHQEELLDKYPDTWVAVFEKRVVGVDPDLRQLLQDLQDRGIPTEKTLVRHLSTKEDLLILAQWSVATSSLVARSYVPS
jgi:Family of unknown function (DUF5678)